MQPIAPATTTTTTFLGALPDGGAPYEAQHITSALPGTSPCAVAVSQFFLGGARDAWIVPVPEVSPPACHAGGRGFERSSRM